jgi:mannose-6-phosphate isomerase-like protein (cupin superfamily)
MKPIQGCHLIKPEDLFWRPSNLMQIPNADFLERTGSENLSTRLWRLPPKSASTLHKHVRQEEFYFVLEGVGRLRVGDEALTVPKYGGVLVRPDQIRQVFNDTDARCFGSSLARRKNWSSCPPRRLRPTCRSFTRPTRNNFPRSCPEWSGRRRASV